MEQELHSNNEMIKMESPVKISAAVLLGVENLVNFWGG